MSTRIKTDAFAAHLYTHDDNNNDDSKDDDGSQWFLFRANALALYERHKLDRMYHYRWSRNRVVYSLRASNDYLHFLMHMRHDYHHLHQTLYNMLHVALVLEKKIIEIFCTHLFARNILMKKIKKIKRQIIKEKLNLISLLNSSLVTYKF